MNEQNGNYLKLSLMFLLAVHFQSLITYELHALYAQG